MSHHVLHPGECSVCLCKGCMYCSCWCNVLHMSLWSISFILLALCWLPVWMTYAFSEVLHYCCPAISFFSSTRISLFTAPPLFTCIHWSNHLHDKLTLSWFSLSVMTYCDWKSLWFDAVIKRTMVSLKMVKIINGYFYKGDINIF